MAEVNRLYRVLTPWRITWYSRSLLLAIGISFIIAVLGGKDASTLTGRLGGDYPAFYGAGRIIAEGDWENLYSPARQLEIQNHLFPNEKAGFLAFSYPPFVALACYPLSLFGYRISYIIYSLLIVGALVLTIQLIRPFNSLIDRYTLSALALLDRKVVKILNQISERTRFMKGLFAWVGFKQIGIPYDRQPRHLGNTKWNFGKLWNFALDGITLFSTSGLKVWSYMGLTISLLSFLYAMFLIIRTLIFGRDVPGYASIMVVVLFLGGLQLISLGILGEYLGWVYAEVKKRPLYIVSDLYGIDQDNQN